MLIRDYSQFGAFGGEWEDWSDAARRAWIEATGDKVEAFELWKKSRQVAIGSNDEQPGTPDAPNPNYKPRNYAAIFHPQTAQGKLARLLPPHWSSNPQIVRDGVAAALEKLAGEAKTVVADVTNVTGGGATTAQPGTSSGGGTAVPVSGDTAFARRYVGPVRDRPARREVVMPDEVPSRDSYTPPAPPAPSAAGDGMGMTPVLLLAAGAAAFLLLRGRGRGNPAPAMQGYSRRRRRRR